MDIERAIEHLLELHARAEVRMQKAEEHMKQADARMDRAEARADRADARMDRFDKQLQATANLLRGGIKLVRGISAEQKKLAQIQARTERKLGRLIEILAHSHANGRPRRNGR